MTGRQPPDTGPTSVLRLTGLIAGVAMAAPAAAIATVIASVHRIPSGAGRLCVAGLHLSYPELNAPAVPTVALAALGIATIIRAARAAWRQRRAHQRFLSAVHVVGELQAHPDVRVIAGRRPEAFCAGFRRPAVYVSEGAVRALAPDELSAVLEHERDHQRVRDPLRIAYGRILARSVFFVPILAAFRDRYADLAEVRADAAAVRAGAVHALASALLVLQDHSPTGNGVSAARVDALLGQRNAWHVPRRSLSASAGMLAAATAALWEAGPGASVRATLNAPLMSSRPCVVVLLIALASLMLAGAWLRSRRVGGFLLHFVVGFGRRESQRPRTPTPNHVAPLPSHRPRSRRPVGLAQGP